MTFDAIRGEISTYETDIAASIVGAELQKIISKHGVKVFKDLALLKEEIQKSELPAVKKEQLLLVCACSTVPDFAANARSDLNLVDVDNIVHNVINTTGLSYKTTLVLVTDILYTCGLHFPVEFGPVLSKQSVEYRLHALLPSAVAETEINKATELFVSFQSKYSSVDTHDKGKQAAAAKTTSMIRKLCEAGIPTGFYLLGRCYLYGECCTDVNRKLGLQYMKIAAEQGHIEAAAQLGDAYYNSTSAMDRSFTLAHHFYSRPGALAVEPSRQKALEDIYAQKKHNTTTIIFSAIVFALTVAFVLYFHAGIFSGSSRLAVGIIICVFSMAAIVLTIIYHIRARFNGIRWVVAIQFFIWALYAFILALS